MRKIVCVFALAALFSCKNEEGDKETSSNLATSVVYPYEATYSSNFKIGKPEYSKIVLDLWKDFDNNTLDNSKSAFADSVSLFFANSQPFIGSRDAAIEIAKQYRGQFSEIKSTINAFVPLKSTDKNEEWVSVWGVEYSTKDGKTDSTYLQETWRFNKDGKVDLMYQFVSKPPVPAEKK